MSTSDVRAEADRLRAERRPFVAATVVRAQRPTSAKPGDTALVLDDGTMIGFVGGECARASVQVQALAALASGEPRLLRITPDAEPGGSEHDGAITVHNPCLSGGALEVFLEPSVPPGLAVVHGDAPIARAVRELAAWLGYEAESFGGDGIPAGTTAVVVASHGDDEAPVLEAALAAGVPYIALVASHRRAEGVLAALDVNEHDRRRIHTPAGLDIGARTPQEVALSIFAEVVGERPRVDAGAPTAAAAPAEVLDPVCGMTVLASESTVHLDRDGVRHWFCSAGCRDAFAAT